MKNVLYILLIIPLALFGQEGLNINSISVKNQIFNIEKDKLNEDSTNLVDSISTNAAVVYICTGAYSYAYHSRSNCPGLNNCRGR